jgi:hypothetical protein
VFWRYLPDGRVIKYEVPQRARVYHRTLDIRKVF